MANEIWEARPEGLKDAELVAWALTEVAAAIRKHYYWMGTANAASPMGAVEFLAKEVRDGCTIIGGALDGLAESADCVSVGVSIDELAAQMKRLVKLAEDSEARE